MKIKIIKIAKFRMSNMKPQKQPSDFDMRHSLFDILRFKRLQGHILRGDRLRSGLFEWRATLKALALPEAADAGEDAV